MTLQLPRYVSAASAARLVAEGTTIAWVLVGSEHDVADSSIGLLLAAATFPQIVIAPWVGRHADSSARPALLLAGLVAVGAVGLGAVGLGLGSVPIGLLMVAAILVAFSQPAMMGALSGLAARATRAATFEAWDAASYGGAAIGAQLLVVAVVAISGPTAAVGALVVLAGLAAIAFARLPLPPAATPAAGGSAVKSIFRVIGADRWLLSVTVLTTVSMSAMGGVALVAVDLAERTGRAADAGGQLVLTMAIGAVCGSIACIRLRPPDRPLRRAALSVAAIGATFAAVASGVWPICLVAFFVAGAADAPLLMSTFTIRNRRTPDAVRASLYTVSASLKIGGTALGAVGVGALLDATAGAEGAIALAVIQVIALVGCGLCWIRSAPMRLNTVRRGAGDPIVFLHGLGTSADTWSAGMDLLADRYTVVAIDLLGHGGSPVPDDPAEYTRDAALNDIDEVLAELDRPAVLVGHSLGGYLALAHAATRPGATRGVVVLNTGPGYRDPVKREEWNARTRRNAHRFGVPEQVTTLNLQEDSVVMERLAEMTTPTLVLAGSEDRAEYTGAGEYLQRKMPDARLVVVDGGEHSMHEDSHAAVVADLIADFVAALEPV